MENFIKQIIEKVRTIYKYDEKYKEILGRKASITVCEDKDGNIQLEAIYFSWYDEILVSKSGIIFKPSYGENQTILRYSSFEEFLKM